MSINLQKGSKTDLTKTNPNVSKFEIGLGWEENKNVGSAFDLDVSAFVIDKSGKKLSDKHFVFYGNLESPSQSVVHTGDNLTGDGAGDDEVLKIDFSKIEDDAEEIVFVVTIYDADSRNQNFGMVRNSYIRVYNPEDNTEILKYELDEDFSIETAVEFGRLYRKDGEWKFNATGQGKRGGLQDYIDQF